METDKLLIEDDVRYQLSADKSGKLFEVLDSIWKAVGYRIEHVKRLELVAGEGFPNRSTVRARSMVSRSLHMLRFSAKTALEVTVNEKWNKQL